jgi:putative hydroxymethylpyrimidine transport system substrate-binding protein
LRASALVVLAVAALSVAAWTSPLTVCLDYLPNPNHIPLYAGVDSGTFAMRGLDVELVVPAGASDPVKLAAAGSADVVLTPQINYLIARNEGLPVVAIGVYIDHSLGGLLALSDRGVSSLADLARRPIGYSLAPLEPALWQAMLACVGVGAADVDLVNVGYNTQSALLLGTVDAIGAFRNVEFVQPEIQARDPIFFAQEDFCVPETYDLILVANSGLVAQRGADLAAFLDAVEESIAATRQSPDAAFASFLRSYPELDDEFDRRSFAATLPLYAEDVHLTDPTTWLEVQRFLIDVGLLTAEVPFESLVVPDPAFTGP